MANKPTKRQGGRGLIAALIATLCSVGVAHAGEAYVANQGNGNVTVLDTSTNAPIASIAASAARIISFSPNGAYAYAARSNSVAKIDTVTKAVVGAVNTGNNVIAVAVSANGNTLYVANNASSTVSIVDATSMTVTSTLSFTGVQALTMTPDGSAVWVMDGFGTVHVLDTATNTELATFATGSAAFWIAFTPDGTQAYLPVSTAVGVRVVDVASRTVVATIPVGANPLHVAISPNGAYAYVANLTGNSVSIIDTATRSVVATVAVGAFPRNVAITPDGNFVYASNFNSNSVSVIDTASRTVTSTLGGFNRPWGIAINPDTDVDGIANNLDNCPLIANADQLDSIGNNIGDACRADVNGDGLFTCIDINIVRGSFGKRSIQVGYDLRADVNRDNVVNVKDLAIVSKKVPAGTSCPVITP